MVTPKWRGHFFHSCGCTSTYNGWASAGWEKHCLYNPMYPPICSQSLIGSSVTSTLSHLNLTEAEVVTKSEHGGSDELFWFSSVLSVGLDPSCFSRVLIVKTMAGNQLLCSVLGRSSEWIGLHQFILHSLCSVTVIKWKPSCPLHGVEVRDL